MLVGFLFLGAVLFAEEGAGKDDAAGFRGFPWGTSLEEFTGREGAPVSRETVDGMVSLAYENKEMSGRAAYMLVYFSGAGLEGGAYYFLNKDLNEVMDCYRELQQTLVSQYGPGILMDEIIREMFPYESSWNPSGAYIHLKANTRTNEPVTLWYSSPALTKKLIGNS
ncbi:MAG: hypothetical protein LBK02_04245 [Treponema sp.]|nr:hypothetical protein [Treponema sp.]